MANTFTDDEKATLIGILGLDIVSLDEQLTYVDDKITTAMDTRIKADIALWKSRENDEDVHVHARERNFGAEIKPGTIEAKIRDRVARMLFIDPATLGTSSTRLVRG